jgi:hypothetical protein
MTQRLLKAVVAVAAIGLLATMASSAFATTGSAKGDNPRFGTVGGVDPQFLANARTIPHFTFRYTDPTNGVTYPITMVGSDPRAGNTSTTVKTVIIPLKVNFVAAGQDTSAIDALYYPGYHATPLTHTFDASRSSATTCTPPTWAATTPSTATRSCGRSSARSARATTSGSTT